MWELGRFSRQPCRSAAVINSHVAVATADITGTGNLVTRADLTSYVTTTVARDAKQVWWWCWHWRASSLPTDVTGVKMRFFSPSFLELPWPLCNFVAVYLTFVQFILQLKLCSHTIVHLLLEDVKHFSQVIIKCTISMSHSKSWSRSPTKTSTLHPWFKENVGACMGVDHGGGGRGQVPPEFGAGDANANCPPPRFCHIGTKNVRSVAFKIRQSPFSAGALPCVPQKSSQIYAYGCLITEARTCVQPGHGCRWGAELLGVEPANYCFL